MRIISYFIDVHVFALLPISLISIMLYSTNIEASLVQSNPFWMPLEFDIGEGYFKANVFVAGLKNTSGLIKICATSQATNHTLCHYMNAPEEEGKIISPYIAVHAGIYVFPNSQIPVNTNLNVCVTTLKDDKVFCKTVRNSGETTEEMIDLNLNLTK
ncbi:MAG TPA: hypothetical protein VJS91_06680 [Nitrososphaeraceae archaeon]|nr:hypothetical protein [Nitrososphaeraceae archaeon]